MVSSSWCNCGTVTVDDDPKRRVEAREVSLASIERAPGMTAGTRFVCRCGMTDAMHSDGDGQSGEAGDGEQDEQGVCQLTIVNR